MTPEPHVYSTSPTAVELEAGTHWWCGCGLSAHQPLCDGSHKSSGMAPVKFTLTEKKKVWLCNCKHSGNKPYCDGSHKTLAATAGS